MRHRCLFLDDWHIGSMEGLKRQGHPAQRYPGNAILTKTFPWEQCRVQLYGRCIVHNAGTQRYQMYYIAQPRCEHYPNVAVAGKPAVGWVTLPCYAESEDGIHWRNEPGWAFRCYSDTGQSVLYDARLGKYVAFGRFNNATFTTSEVTYGKDTGTAFNIGRNVARVESEDFLHWSEPELVLAADS